MWLWTVLSRRGSCQCRPGVRFRRDHTCTDVGGTTTDRVAIMRLSAGTTYRGVSSGRSPWTSASSVIREMRGRPPPHPVAAPLSASGAVTDGVCCSSNSLGRWISSDRAQDEWMGEMFRHFFSNIPSTYCVSWRFIDFRGMIDLRSRAVYDEEEWQRGRDVVLA